jgi:lysyl oxidase-like protein 2/3/4
MDNVLCDGTESELAQCRFDGWGKTDCEGGEAAGVICDYFAEDIRTNGTRVSSKILNLMKSKQGKSKIRDVHQQGIALRLTGFGQGRVEIKLGDSGT